MKLLWHVLRTRHLVVWIGNGKHSMDFQCECYKLFSVWRP